MSAADIPLIILIGGAAGTGKTPLANNTYSNNIRDFTVYLNNWASLKKKLK